MKKCNTCKQEKLLNEFKKDSTRKGGYAYQCKQCAREYYQKTKAQRKKYYLNTKEEHLKRAKLNYIENTERYKEYNKDYSKNNRDKFREYDKKYYYSNPHERKWRSLLRTTIEALSINKTFPTQQLLRYSALELKEHLENQGIDWNIHHIDHKVPISWFKEDTPPHIVNDLRNLQPLTEEENKSKSNKFCSPIEDSYIQLIEKWVKPQYKDKLI